MKEERLKKEKQDMLGFYDYTVVLTYISLAVSVFGMTRALEGDFKVAILCLALSGLCDMFDGKIARTKKNRTEDEKKFGIQIDSLCDVVCFGVFPAMICYCLGMNHIPGVIILCLYCVASVIRLGYFNVSDDIGKILKKQRKPAILVTHDISEAISMADRVLILSKRPATVIKIVPIVPEK